ncbi:MAG: hypothetical protein RIR11_3244 [Bacteroidota bacterium]|jgi:hypothetical protein
MIKKNTKIGDIFVVETDNNTQKYFQYIANDLLQLNSDVIRVFSQAYPLEASPDLNKIVQGEVSFFAHTMTKLGIKMGLWKKVGNVEYNNNIQMLFRGAEDSGSKPGEQVLVSEKWYIWKLGDSDFTYVGKLTGENVHAEIGSVKNPIDIVHRIKTGEYSYFYPGF